MSELKPCPKEAEALEIIESMLDVADMRNKGPIYADDPPRSGLCRIPEEDAAILRQYIADRRAQSAANEPPHCLWLSDSEVTQPCIEGPCPHETVLPANEPLCKKNENFIQTKYGYCFYALGPCPIIYNLYVHPQYRRHGYSKVLLGLVIGEIRKSGYTGKIRIEAKPRENSIGVEDLTAYYESMGLAVCETRKLGAGANAAG